MENELYHYRLKGDRNGFTRIKGYNPIGERAKEVVAKVKGAVTKTTTTVKEKVASIISGLSMKKTEEGVQATQTALASIGEKKVQAKGKTFDTSTGIDEPKSKAEKPAPKPSGATASKDYTPEPSVRKTPTEIPDYSPDEVNAVVDEWNKRYEEIGLKPPAIPDEELKELLENRRRQMSHSIPKPADEMANILMHYGIPKQKWGVRHGPPYPLDWDDKSAAQKKASPSALRPSNEMTTEELREANARMREEEDYNRHLSNRTPKPGPSAWETADQIASYAKKGVDYYSKYYENSKPKPIIRRGGPDAPRQDYTKFDETQMREEANWHENYKKVVADDPVPTGRDKTREILQTLGTVTAFASALTTIGKTVEDLKKK